ncbi:hypothetical protein PYCCODRAFT_1451181 [Trametes coccinea BRFM310]|uniref:Transcription initiation factor IIF subunit alpha n=1 Tax=Trametes coccinea (strain BRFM310) TaxID=1353009 RepID=A0A1Y2IT69_TRAC3|nr:hypothetical protein PYCCODRAFT_1451181 [Trametes coccinea BRFM310]
MAKGAASLFNPKPSRPTLPKKENSTNTPSPVPSQSAPGTPKKPIPATASSRPGSATAPARRPAPAPKPKAEDEELKPPPPEGPYSEFRLLSSKLNGWKYDVMKFESRKRVDINTWAQPVKLNRKEPRREDPQTSSSQQPVTAMVGSDGKLVVGADGKVVMVDAAGRPVRQEPPEPKEEKGKDKDKKKRFQKKTRQVFLVPEEVRQLRREERFPWVMEDAKHQEVWVGKMEEVAKSQTYAMFMPAADDVFKFVPAHRWYKFQKKPHYHVPNLEEAESLMTKMQKHKDATHWTLRQKTEQAASGSSLVYNASQSLGPGGRKLKTVDSGPAELFGGEDDDEEGGDRKRKVKRELGAEGFLDELDFEETFADDEEKMDVDDKEDEEAKELEERLKKEYKNANKLREGYIDESDEEEDEAKLTGAGKNLQKTLKKLDKDGAYDESDDEEKNPYASEEEEEEEEEVPIVPTGPAIIPPEPKPGMRSGSQPATPGQPGKPATNGQSSTTVKSESQSQSLSRPTSPAPAPSGGHSLLARRATSPSMPKPKPGISSRAGSPLASPNGVSPPASRATSPSASGTATPSGAKPLKRKATDDGSGAGSGSSGAPGAAPRPKKRKAQLPPGAELEDRMVIEWLRNTPNATTRECILHFTPYLTDEEKKNKFTALVKEVAQLSKGVLVLRPAYRDAAAAPAAPTSPAVTQASAA